MKKLSDQLIGQYAKKLYQINCSWFIIISLDLHACKES